MTREQYKRSSKVAYPGVMLTCAVVLLTLVGAVAFQVSQSYVSIIIQIIGIIISMILATVSYLLKKEEKIGMIGIAGAGAVMYLLVSFVNRNEYVFLYGFIILFLSMTYLNRRLIVWGNCFIIVGFIVHCIKIQMLHGVAADWVALGAVTIVLCCVASITVISLLLKYNEENVSAISKKAEEQEKTAKALMEIAEQITESFDKASAVLISLNEAVEANDEAMQNIADSTTGTAESVQAQAEMCLEIQKETDMAGQGIEKMMNASDKTKVMVGEGAELILELKEQAHVVEDTNKSTVEATQRLALKVENVKEIIGAILSISSQTNLLALNASIEAARAGEAGRGFAVVAEQIRTLSENTRESANQITNIIEELIADVTVTNGSVDVSSATIEKQSEMIDEAKKKFDLIEEEVSELVANINATEGVMKQILKATGVISDNISHLSANSEEVAATSEEGTKIAKRGVEDIRLVDNEMAHIYKLAEQLKRV